MSILEADLTVLARGLVDPDRAVRDHTFVQFQQYAVQLRDVSDLNMLKLWKALYYCLWLADGEAVQKDVCLMIAKMLHQFQTSELQLLYMKMFFVTILREWTLVDQYRANKLYILIRFFLREVFGQIVTANYSPDVMNSIVEILATEVLMKTPNGVRFHVTDMYLEELALATEGRITSRNFLTLIQPFLKTITGTADAVYKERVNKRIFQLFLSSYAAENAEANESLDKPFTLFKKVNTKLIQAMIFEMASGDAGSIDESSRRKLYQMHKEFQFVTKVEHIDLATAFAMTKSEKTEKKNKKASVEEAPVTKPSKVNKSEKMVVEEPLAPVPVVEPVSKKRPLSADSAAVKAKEVSTPVAAEKAEKVKKVKVSQDDSAKTIAFEKVATEKTAAGKASADKVASEKASAAEKASVKAAAEKVIKEKDAVANAAAKSEADKAKAMLASVSGVKPGATVVNGVTIEITKQSTDPKAAVAMNRKRIKMHYTGKLKNGKVFDTSIGKKPFAFRLGAGEVIRGWDIGIVGMKVGEKRTLTIPPEKGYGKSGSPPVIPGNATLIFDVQCLEVIG